MSITFFEHGGFRGQTLSLHESAPNFVKLGFNDKASSIIVTNGTWIVYEHVDYKGRSYKISAGKYDFPNLHANIGNDTISSAKLVEASPCVTLYEHADFQGTALPLTESVPNFVAIGFNDVTSSVIVSGGTWILYEHVDYQGRSMTLKPGKYGLNEIQSGIGNDKASSVKLLTCEIVLYEHAGCKGKALPLTESTPSLVGLDFNDKTSSIIVVSGTWTVYEHVEYQGRSKQLTKGYYDYNQISSVIGNDVISSVKLDSF